MMKAAKAIMIILMLGLLYAQSVPMLINYQAKLVDDSNDPITGTVSVTFRLYDAVEGGTQLWSEDHSSIESNNGLISVLLGSVTTFDNSVFLGSSIFLETEVEGFGILSPRQQLTSVPFAIAAKNTVRVIKTGISSGNVYWGEDGYAPDWTTCYDTTFSPNTLAEFISGSFSLHNSPGGEPYHRINGLTCRVTFGLENSEDQQIEITGGDFSAWSTGYYTSESGYNPQGNFFFPVLPAYESQNLRLYMEVKITRFGPSHGSISNGVVWGK